MSVMVIVLSLGLFGIIVGVAYWFAREEQKTIKRIPPEEMDEKERQARREAAANIANFPPSQGGAWYLMDAESRDRGSAEL